MSFISKAEFSGSIATTIINTLTSNNDEAVSYWVDNSVEFMKSYLRTNYSADTFFEQTGNSRSKLLMSYCKDLAIYNLYSMSYIFRKIPTIREKRYADAITWLESVQSEKINPLLYGTGTTGYTHLVTYGGNDAQENYMT
ncbi:MAG: phage protein Gp36 family protein [Bacteroidota bacterium]